MVRNLESPSYSPATGFATRLESYTSTLPREQWGQESWVGYSHTTQALFREKSRPAATLLMKRVASKRDGGHVNGQQDLWAKNNELDPPLRETTV